MAIELTPQEQLKACRVASTFMGKLCIGGAKALKGTGFVLEKSTKLTASGLRVGANVIESAGQVSSGLCYSQAEKLEGKSRDYKEDSETITAILATN